MQADDAIGPIHSTDTLGAELRTRRRQLGFTQDDIANIIGVNRRVISQLENGKPTVRVGIVLDVSRALGIDPFLHLRK